MSDRVARFNASPAPRRRGQAALLTLALLVGLIALPASAFAAPTISVTDPTEDMSQHWILSDLPAPTSYYVVYSRADVTTPCQASQTEEARIGTQISALSDTYGNDVAPAVTRDYRPERSGTFRFCIYARPNPGGSQSSVAIDPARIGQVDITIRRPTGTISGSMPALDVMAPAVGQSTIVHKLTLAGVSEAKRKLYMTYGRDDRACGVTRDADAGDNWDSYGRDVSGNFAEVYELQVRPDTIGHHTYCAWLAETTADSNPIAVFRIALDIRDPNNPTGAPLCTVPAVKGLTATQAIGAIVKAGCAFPTVKVTNSQAVKPGQALKLNHVSGASIPNITPLVLHMRRARICTVPKLKGATLAQARIRAVASGCKVGKVTKKAVTGVAVGRVASVKPGVGKQLKYGSKLTLVMRK